MDAFSYLSVLLSIILGLAITQVLQGLGRLLQERSRVTPYWPAVGWAVLLLVIAVQSWWALFGLREYPRWTFGAFAVVLLQFTLTYMLAALVLPDFSAPGPIDLRANYFQHARWFYLLAAAMVLSSLLKELVLSGRLGAAENTAFHLVFIALAAASAFVRRDWFHKAQLVTMAALFTAYVALLFTRLQ